VGGGGGVLSGSPIIHKQLCIIVHYSYSRLADNIENVCVGCHPAPSIVSHATLNLLDFHKNVYVAAITIVAPARPIHMQKKYPFNHALAVGGLRRPMAHHVGWRQFMVARRIRTAGFIVGLDIVALVLKLCTKGYLRQILGLSQSKIPGNTLSFSPLPVVIKISQNDNDASLPNENRCI
jgi:hypothetical protein